MDRIDLEHWFAHHPDSPHGGQPDMLLDECEREVREHARHDAWLHARDIARDNLHRFERIFGLPASDTFVTREVCHEIARELRHREPRPADGDCAAWIDNRLAEDLDSNARLMLRAWMMQLAEQEEHEAWREIVHFTDHLAKDLIRKAQMTNHLEWDLDQSYPRVAARVARMLIVELEAHAAADLQPPIEMLERH